MGKQTATGIGVKRPPAEQAAVEKMADEAASAVNLSTADEMKAAIRQAVFGAFEAGKAVNGWVSPDYAMSHFGRVDLWVRQPIQHGQFNYYRMTDCWWSGRDGKWGTNLTYVPHNVTVVACRRVLEGPPAATSSAASG